MAGRQAKVISDAQLGRALEAATRTRFPARNRVMLLLSHKAGLRACEIARLRWEMVLDADGSVSDVLDLPDEIAKMGHGRTVPLNRDLRAALVQLAAEGHARPGLPVVRSERAALMRPGSVVDWFGDFYRDLGMAGASSHSGRRGFITRAARQIAGAGGSIRDVQQLAGHASLATTQTYIEGATEAKRRVVDLL